MRRALLILCACLLLAGFAWPDAADMLGKRLVAPGGGSPILPTARTAANIARLPHRQGRGALHLGACGKVTKKCGAGSYWTPPLRF